MFFLGSSPVVSGRPPMMQERCSFTKAGHF